MKQKNFEEQSNSVLENPFLSKTRAVLLSLLTFFVCCNATICAANPLAVAGLILGGAALIKDVLGGSSVVTYYMMVFDKTYTRRYFSVEVSDRYLMNVSQSGKAIFKHTYTLKFPGYDTRQIEDNQPWEYNSGGTTMFDHQIEVRDFVCKRGGDFSGMDEDLKVSFTMKAKWQTDANYVLPTRVRFAISGWDECPSDCTGWPAYNVGDVIDWSADIFQNGEAQVKVSPIKPSFRVNRSFGSRGSISVTAG